MDRDLLWFGDWKDARPTPHLTRWLRSRCRRLFGPKDLRQKDSSAFRCTCSGPRAPPRPSP